MTFRDWQSLPPATAARELRRRVDTLLSPEQRRAVIAQLPDEATLTERFTEVPAGSPLGGVPYLLKDLFDVTGVPTFAGSTFLPEIRPIPTADATLVGMLKAA